MPASGSPHPSGGCTGNFSLLGAEHIRQPTSSPHPTGECTASSFSLPDAEHKHQPTGSPHMNLQADEFLTVFLCQVQIGLLLAVGPTLARSLVAFNLSLCHTPLHDSFQICR